MITKSPVFEETLKNYLGQVGQIELKSLEDKLGVEVEKDEVIVPFFGKPYRVSEGGVIDPSGKQPPLEISVVLCKYLLLCPKTNPIADQWVSYRDFKDSGPLTSFFLNAVEQPVANHFSGRLGELKASCDMLGGYQPLIELSYELSVQFSSIPFQRFRFFCCIMMRMMNFLRIVPYFLKGGRKSIWMRNAWRFWECCFPCI